MNDNSLEKKFEEWIKINLVDKKLGLIDIKNRFIYYIEKNNNEIVHNYDNFNTILAKLLTDMTNEGKLCKEEKKGNTKFYYNPNLYSKTQDNIIKTQKRNKRIVIAIVSIFLVSILVIAIYNNIKENERIKQKMKKLQMLKRKCQRILLVK